MIAIRNYEYNEWCNFINNLNKNCIIREILHLIFTLDVIEYKGQIYYDTNSVAYINKVSDIFRYLYKIDNYILYNKLYELFITKHNSNIEFETNFNTMLKEGQAKKSNKVVKSKEDRVKTETPKTTWIIHETEDLFEGKKQYLYENLKTGETITSDNPNMLEELKSRKKTKREPKTIKFTFNFNKK
jgi:hypothetical protein